MNSLWKIPILDSNRSNFKETSKDDNNSEVEVSYMTDSEIEVLDFDKVKEEYINGMGLVKVPRSNDALYIGEKKLTFIEFKNGKINRTKAFEVHNKIYDSLLILGDILDKNIKFFRENLDFVLVYNEEKNQMKDDTAKIDKKGLQESPSRREIATHFLKKAGKELIRFDLEQFKTYCFSEVHTYTENEFVEKFIKKLS